MKKFTKIILWVIGIASVVLVGLFLIGMYSFDKITNYPGFQQTLREVDESNPGVVAQSSVDISLIPEYGGFEKTLEQKKLDQEFIDEFVRIYGNREKGAKVAVEAGNKYYQKDDLDMAMRRYNQAWLLDENNPGVYIGFGNILKKRGQEEEANKMMQRASELDQ